MSEFPETLDAALRRLERDSGWEGCAHDRAATPELRIQLSTAISLKRIADALDGTVTGLTIGDTIERAIGTGMFNGFQNLKR